LLAVVLQAVQTCGLAGGLPKQLPGHAASPTALHALVQLLLQELICPALAVVTWPTATCTGDHDDRTTSAATSTTTDAILAGAAIIAWLGLIWLGEMEIDVGRKRRRSGFKASV